MDSTFKIEEISMSFPSGYFYAVSMSNRCNCFTRSFLSIIFALGTYSQVTWYSAESMYSDIEVITGVGTIETIFFGNLDQRKEI